MTEWLNELAHARDIAFWAAFALGLLTAIAPCPLATNITATAFIAKGFTDKRKVLLSGLLYTLAFLLGVIFALAFCPYSGVLYFGSLIPMTIASPDGLYLPLVFAFGTGLPVLLVQLRLIDLVFINPPKSGIIGNNAGWIRC